MVTRPIRLALISAACAGSIASAQTAPQAPGTPIALHASADGRVDVSAAGVALEDVIRAVAGTINLDTRTVGDPPREPVSVAFEARPVLDVLRELMEPAGISFLIADSSSTRRGTLIMGRLPEGQDGSSRLLLELRAARADADSAVDAQTAQTPLPDSIERPNAGSEPPLPKTADELYQIVNGGPPVPYSGPMSPNLDGSPAPANGFGIVRGVATPAPVDGQSRPTGVTAPGIATKSAPMTPNVGPPPPPDPAMMKPPDTVQVPPPPVVYFPPANKP